MGGAHTPLPHIAGPAEFAGAFAVSPPTIARLVRYAELLARWRRVVSLVAPSTAGDVWHRHFADSAQLLPLVAGARTLVDLGTGAGFPGLVLAIVLADAESTAGHARRITLIESNARKCAFLAEVVRAVELPSSIAVDILSTRIEEAATQASVRGADVIAARALAPLDRLLGLAVPLFTSATVGLFLKGREAVAELEVARQMFTFSAELLASRTARDSHIVLIRHPCAHTSAGRGHSPKGALRDRRTTRG